MDGTRSDVENIYRGFVARMNPEPVLQGIEHLPESPQFILAANHYQRPGLWIAHIASVLACAMADRYRCTPPIRWLVTANWPRWRIGPLNVPSPGDLLLPRVAHAAWCYAVPFEGTNAVVAGRTLRRLMKDSGSLKCPIGVFPEGAKASADALGPPLAGIGRLFTMLAAKGWRIVPAGVSEGHSASGAHRRFFVRFGPPIGIDKILNCTDAGRLAMEHIEELTVARASA